MINYKAAKKILIKSNIKINKEFIENAKNLKIVARARISPPIKPNQI